MRNGILICLFLTVVAGAGVVEAETTPSLSASMPMTESVVAVAPKDGTASKATVSSVDSASVFSQAKPDQNSLLEGLKIGVLAYASYQDGSKYSGVPGRTEDFSKFTLKRGYLSVSQKINPNLTVRITPDITQDSGGDWKLRLKYLYAKFQWTGRGVVQKPYVEFGLAHTPWLDFEGHINRYRMQDHMFLERSGLFNSADAGILIGGNLGESLPASYLKKVNKYEAGRWGSFQFGVFNGGGYHAKEENDNKVFEGRVTLRPLPDTVPGLQFSLFGLSGDGNLPDDEVVPAPKWDVLNAMVSFESRLFVATAQFVEATGNQKGTAVDLLGQALEQDGYSFFAEWRYPGDDRFSVIARYDRFDTNTNDPTADVKERSIFGLAWQFWKSNYWLLDYDRLEHSTEGFPKEDRVQLTLQLKY